MTKHEAPAEVLANIEKSMTVVAPAQLPERWRQDAKVHREKGMIPGFVAGLDWCANELERALAAGKVVETDEAAEACMSNLLMEFADMAAAWPNAKPDSRAWGHAMVYAPPAEQAGRDAIAWREDSPYGRGYAFADEFFEAFPSFPNPADHADQANVRTVRASGSAPDGWDEDAVAAMELLGEARRFATTSPRAQESINFALDVLDRRPTATTPASAPDDIRHEDLPREVRAHVEVLRAFCAPHDAAWRSLCKVMRALATPPARALADDHGLCWGTTSRVVDALTRLGISVPESPSEQAARAESMVLTLCHEVINRPFAEAREPEVTDSMVERAAFAVAAGGQSERESAVPWDDLPEELRGHARAQVRVVLAALQQEGKSHG